MAEEEIIQEGEYRYRIWRRPDGSIRVRNKLCNAKNNTCRGFSRKHNDKCRSHGGNTPGGIASPNFKHGKNSRYLTALPTRMRETFREAQQRKDFLTLSPEIALVETRLEDVLLRVDTGEGGIIWERLNEAWTAFEQAMSESDIEMIKVQTRVLQILIKKGGEDWETWQEIGKLLEQRRKLVESEVKRIKDQQETLTAVQAYYLFNTIASLINEHVADPQARSKIQAGWNRIFDLSKDGQGGYAMKKIG